MSDLARTRTSARGPGAISLVAALALALVAACRDDERVNRARGASTGELAGATPGIIEDADDGQWPMAAKDVRNTRFTALDELTPANVGNLELAWAYATGTERGLEAAPLVVGDTMYVITPYPNELHALDVLTGAPRWIYEPVPDPASQGVACCDVVNRGGSYHDGKIYYALLDTNVVAVDAKTGKQVWKVRLGDINKGETITMAPLVVKGKVLVGNSGGEMGVRGWLTALDANDGHIVWRAYHTGPDKDVLIGPDYKPYYDMNKGTDLGVTTWPPDRPAVPVLWALPRRARHAVRAVAARRAARGAVRVLTTPLVALALHLAVRVGWHLPSAFGAALADERVHALQHATFTGSAALVWWVVLQGRFGRAGYGVGVAFVFLTMMGSGVLAAMLSLGDTPWYAAHAARSVAAGFDPVSDQRRAGLFMWVPAGTIMTATALALLAAWIGDARRRMARSPHASLRSPPA